MDLLTLSFGIPSSARPARSTVTAPVQRLRRTAHLLRWSRSIVYRIPRWNISEWCPKSRWRFRCCHVSCRCAVNSPGPVFRRRLHNTIFFDVRPRLILPSAFLCDLQYGFSTLAGCAIGVAPAKRSTGLPVGPPTTQAPADAGRTGPLRLARRPWFYPAVPSLRLWSRIRLPSGSDIPAA